jgi:3,4-dihydroxy 2-butanone 4-phosphate synthase/GTP cyclohydrolase II
MDMAKEKSMQLNSVEEIVADIRAGRMVIMMDDEDRENEGDLIMAAEMATPEAIAFFVRYTSGIICAPVSGERLEELRLPQMVPDNTEAHRTAFTVSVDYRHGTTTGISAADRAATIRGLADPEARPGDFARPGHIFPLRYADGGVLIRAGHTEASVDLVKLAGFDARAAVICEIVNDDGTMKRGQALFDFAHEHGLKIGTIADLIRYRMEKEQTVERVAENVMPTEFGDFRVVAFKDYVSQSVHLALVRGDVDPEQPTLVRVQVEDTLRDLVHVGWDALGWPLRSTLARIAEDGGVIIILRDQENTGDMVERIRHFPEVPERRQEREDGTAVLRTYGVGAQILVDLGVRRMRVLSAPKRMHGISGFGLEVVEYVED